MNPLLAQEFDMSVVDSERFESLSIAQKRSVIQMRISNYVSQLFELELTKGEADAVLEAGIEVPTDPMGASQDITRRTLGAKVDFLNEELDLLDTMADLEPAAPAAAAPVPTS